MSTKKYIGSILSLYEGHFGCPASEVVVNKYWNEQDGDAPPICVCLFKKADTGFFCDVAVTAGMSSRPMNFGATYSGERWTSELIQYFDSVEREDVDWLIWLACLPHWDQFALGVGHTVSYPKPLYAGSDLSKFLFLNTIVTRDRDMFRHVEPAVYPVELLWVVPLTNAEYELKKEAGLDVILDLFDEHSHPVLLDKLRISYV